MANRPEVATASAPIVALDAMVLGAQLVSSLARVPFRRPLSGSSTLASNLVANTTREVVRSFMGYASSLPVPEFRSVELMLDELCKVVMPSVVRSYRIDRRELEIAGVPGILYLPKDEAPEGLILYLHGGGYIGTSPTMYAFFTARLAAETRCAMFVADYRLAPEFPYPAGLDDATEVVTALLEMGIPHERLLIAGDSGGGGLANSVMLDAHIDHGRATPGGLILFSPEVDLLLDEPSVTENADLDILPWNIPTSAYLHGVDAASGAVSAIDADLTGFPPTFVSWGGNEMFRDPIRRFVGRLASADVVHHAHEEPGMFHVFPILLPWAEVSHKVARHVEVFVRTVLNGAPPLSSEAMDRLLDAVL